jgi:Protein of unknown function (DUF1064)
MKLDAMKKAGEVASWEGQVKVPLFSHGKHVCTIIPDFLVQFRDGHSEYHEFKGRVTPLWRLKVKLFMAQFPNAIYKVIYA